MQPSHPGTGRLSRRQFLDQSAAGVAALGLASTCANRVSAEVAERKYRLAFMGVNADAN